MEHMQKCNLALFFPQHKKHLLKTQTGIQSLYAKNPQEVGWFFLKQAPTVSSSSMYFEK